VSTEIQIVKERVQQSYISEKRLSDVLQDALQEASAALSQLAYVEENLGALASAETANLLLYELPVRLAALELVASATTVVPYLQRTFNANLTATELQSRIMAGANITVSTIVSEMSITGAQALAVTSDGTCFLAGGRNGNMTLYQSADLARLWEADLGPASVSALDLSSDGTLGAAALDNGTLVFFRLNTGLVHRSIVTPDTSGIAAVRFAHDNARLFSAGSSGKVHIWSVANGSSIVSFGSPQNTSITAIALSSADNILALIDTKGEHVAIWNVTEGTLESVLAMKNGSAAVSVALSANASSLYVGTGNAGTVQAYGRLTDSTYLPLAAYQSGCQNGVVSSLALSASQARLVAATSCSAAVSFDVTSADPRWIRKIQTSAAVIAATLSAESDILVLSDSQSQTAVCRRLELEW
jgi:WD40 repeat protein